MQRGEMAIVGAGIGGLALAVAARQIGWTPVVYERQPAACTNGGILLVWANGLRALSALGLTGFEAGTIPSCTRVKETLFKNWQGDLLLTLPSPDPGKGGLPSLLVPRGTLIEALVAAADPDGTRIRWDHECTGFSALGRGVVPRLRVTADPTQPLAASPADMLVGCDGSRSVVRRQLFPRAEPPRSAYHNAWTGLSHVREEDWPYAPGHTVAFVGGGPRLCASTLDDDQAAPRRRRVYWYASEARLDLADTPRPTGEDIAVILAEHSDAAANLVRSTVDLAGGQEPYRYPICDHRPRHAWFRDRAGLLGDSIHAVTPDLGQGACQSLESALFLAQAIRESGDVPSAFARYERRRRDRTARIGTLSRLTAILSMVHGRGIDSARESALRSLLPSMLEREVSRLMDAELPCLTGPLSVRG